MSAKLWARRPHAVPAAADERMPMAAEGSPAVDHSRIMNGLPVKLIKSTALSLGLAPDALAGRIGLSRATYNRKRHRANTALGPLISDALARYQSLVVQAVATFDGDENSARQWLTNEQPGLGGAVPVEFARSTVGYREVEKLLTRIDRGVYA